MAVLNTTFAAGGAVETPHPDYIEAKHDWEQVRDVLSGDRRVKERGECYLPRPSGFKIAQDGEAMYQAYKMRAKLPPLLEPILRGMAGILNKAQPTIQMPDAMNDLRERATRTGDPIEILYRRIIRELLTTGRVGLLVDMPDPTDAIVNSRPGDLPYIAFYEAERVINWSRDRDFFVLDETRLLRDGFTWWPQRRFRVLALDDDGSYQVLVYDYALNGQTYVEKEATLPIQRGGATFSEIPFVTIGCLDLAPEIGEIPLLGVAQAALANYRLDADYRLQLYMSGQETFVVIGEQKENAPKALGASVIITLPAQADAKYVGPNCKGIDAHKNAKDDEIEAAAQSGARMFINAQRGRTAESADALKLRFAGETATLNSVAQTAAEALERSLRYCAMFMNSDPDEVVVKPNTHLVDATMQPTEAVALMQLCIQGAISHQTLYENLQRGDIASADRSLDEEQGLIGDEVPPPSPRPALPGMDIRGPLGKPPTDSQLNDYRANGMDTGMGGDQGRYA